ncbi:SDR family oxidoreductase, partial [Acinetobacter baumannii]
EYVPQERHDLYVNGRAIQRQQLPQDLNGTALYLLSDLSSFVTGQNIPVNGGFVFN